MTGEFEHYEGCKFKDPDNCSGCALTTGGAEGPNYSAWPLIYIENGRSIPARWMDALFKELRSENVAYARNILATMQRYGVRFERSN